MLRDEHESVRGRTFDEMEDPPMVSSSLPPSWDDWQIEEDLREARRQIALHQGLQMQSGMGGLAGLERQTFALGASDTQASSESLPMAIPLHSHNGTGDSMTAAAIVDLASDRHPSRRGWVAIAFAIWGLIGGFAAMGFAQQRPEYFGLILFLELGIGGMMALLMNRPANLSDVPGTRRLGY